MYLLGDWICGKISTFSAYTSAAPCSIFFLVNHIAHVLPQIKPREIRWGGLCGQYCKLLLSCAPRDKNLGSWGTEIWVANIVNHIFHIPPNKNREIRYGDPDGQYCETHLLYASKDNNVESWGTEIWVDSIVNHIFHIPHIKCREIRYGDRGGQ